MLLQDEDQEVRGSASDFMSVPSPLISEGAHSLPGESKQDNYGKSSILVIRLVCQHCF